MKWFGRSQAGSIRSAAVEIEAMTYNESAS